VAKGYYIRVLAFKLPCFADDRLHALQGMATYHKERKEWKKMEDCCEKASTLVPKSRQDPWVLQGNERILLRLADAAEEQGGLRRAREYDEKAKRIWSGWGKAHLFIELMACNRREAGEAA
jgi:hypothetical protein